MAFEPSKVQLARVSLDVTYHGSKEPPALGESTRVTPGSVASGGQVPQVRGLFVKPANRLSDLRGGKHSENAGELLGLPILFLLRRGAVHDSRPD
jgi:hypothetical protein